MADNGISSIADGSTAPTRQASSSSSHRGNRVASAQGQGSSNSGQVKNTNNSRTVNLDGQNFDLRAPRGTYLNLTA